VSAGFGLFVRCLVIGVAVAAPVGAMGVLCIQRTLLGGWRSGMATGLGIATADGAYAAIAAFGVTSISSELIALQTPLRLVGGSVLVLLGVWAVVRALRTGESEACEEYLPQAPGALALYVSGVSLTLTNPLTIMAFAAVFASAGLAVAPGLGTATTATLGVALGSLAWWTALVTGVSRVRHAVGARAVKAISAGSGVVIAGFGVFAIVSALR
jgi:threonine/homoserine/homoserine lactone efflux protein